MTQILLQEASDTVFEQQGDKSKW